MKLISTRNSRECVSFSEAVQVGMASAGGLWVPESIPVFTDVETLLEMDFGTRSVEVAHRFLGDEFERDELDHAVRSALNFPAPLVGVGDGLFALELFHGPTLAFKDFGARFLARMLGLISEREPGGHRTVLTATSGDTGSAVARAFEGMPGVRVVVLYPKGRVSEVQEKQFATLGGNIFSYAVGGTFDDCQAMVKSCFRDAALASRLRLTSANSINIARLLGQVMYYYEALAQLRGASGAYSANGRRDPVIAVPCGNFGNLYAGLLAWKTGLPVKAFVVATNANRTVPDFLETGNYRTRPSVTTISNAMDVGTPSNWERVRSLFGDQLEPMRAVLRWGSRSDGETRASIRELYGAGYMADPHGAVAHGVLRNRLGPDETGVFLATAHPAKFREVLAECLNLAVELPPSLADVLSKPVLSRPLEANVEALKTELLA